MTLDEAKRHQNEIESLTMQLNRAMINAAGEKLVVTVTNHTKTNMNGIVANMLVIDTMIYPDDLEA